MAGLSNTFYTIINRISAELRFSQAQIPVENHPVTQLVALHNLQSRSKSPSPIELKDMGAKRGNMTKFIKREHKVLIRQEMEITKILCTRNESAEKLCKTT